MRSVVHQGSLADESAGDGGSALSFTKRWCDYPEAPVAIVTEEIEDTPVVVPVAKAPILNSVSETELLDSEVLPL